MPSSKREGSNELPTRSGSTRNGAAFQERSECYVYRAKRGAGHPGSYGGCEKQTQIA